MGIASDMKNLTQDIVGSYDVRMEFEARRVRESQKENEERAKDVGNMLKGFHKAHEEMAEELRAKLSKDEAQRVKETKAEIKARASEVENLLESFRDEREKMAGEWQNLTSMMANRRSGRYKPKPKGEMGEEPKAEEGMEPTRKRRRRRKQE